MERRRRSQLLFELTRPFPRPRVTIPPGPASTRTYETAVEARHIPLRIVSNPNFLRQIYRDFCDFCERHHQRGNDRLGLAGIELARRNCGRRQPIRSEAQGVSFVDQNILQSVRTALQDLEQNPDVDSENEVREPAIGTRSDIQWQDNGIVRVIWQQKSPHQGNHFFQRMDIMAQNGTRFQVRGRSHRFPGASGIIVKVGPLFFGVELLQTYVFSQAAVEASHNNCRYVVFHSGFDMIVHRLVRAAGSRTQYYLEASPRIPIDSQEYPHMALIAAIVFDARVRGPLDPLPVVNVPRFNPGRGGYPTREDRVTTRRQRSQGMPSVQETYEEHDRYYNGLHGRSQTVRSSSQFILTLRPFLADIDCFRQCFVLIALR
jgi:hypothetical protein